MKNVIIRRIFTALLRWCLYIHTRYIAIRHYAFDHLLEVSDSSVIVNFFNIWYPETVLVRSHEDKP